MFCVVLDYSCFEFKLKGKKFKKNTFLKSYKNEIKILANLGLAWSGLEQPGPGLQSAFYPGLQVCNLRFTLTDLTFTCLRL